MLKIVENYENYELKRLCNEFIYSNRPKYVMGRNEFALSIAENIDIDGFIDDFTSDTNWNNKPIVPIEKVPKNAIVAVAVVGIQPLTAINRVKNYKLEYIDYFSLFKYSNLKLKSIPFIEGFAEDFYIKYNMYETIYNQLADDESKKQFNNIINFRLTYDLYFMKDFSNIQEKQYFEPFIKLMPGSVFVDIGGYDGLTSYTFIQKCPEYRTIHFFEPDENNLKVAIEKLKEFKNIFYYKNGVSDKHETLYFKSSGSSSKIDYEGDITIETLTLDDCIHDNCTYIKMDVEGWESKAIDGAKRIIQDFKPSLAVCVYHKSDDLWKIPEQVLSIRNDYKLFLRHYTEGITETVMYFV